MKMLNSVQNKIPVSEFTAFPLYNGSQIHDAYAAIHRHAIWRYAVRTGLFLVTKAIYHAFKCVHAMLAARRKHPVGNTAWGRPLRQQHARA